MATLVKPFSSAAGWSSSSSSLSTSSSRWSRGGFWFLWFIRYSDHKYGDADKELSWTGTCPSDCPLRPCLWSASPKKRRNVKKKSKLSICLKAFLMMRWTWLKMKQWICCQTFPSAFFPSIVLMSLSWNENIMSSKFPLFYLRLPQKISSSYSACDISLNHAVQIHPLMSEMSA